MTGFDKSAPLRIGSAVAWTSDIPDARAGFLKFSGAGLTHLEKAIDKAERRMALLGAHMLEPRSPGEDESAAPARGGGGDLCGLGYIVASLNRSLTAVLKLAHQIATGQPAPASVQFTMNTDLTATTLSGEDLNAIVAAWRAGAISRDTMLDRLKRGDILPDTRTIAQERALLHRRAGETAPVSPQNF